MTDTTRTELRREFRSLRRSIPADDRPALDRAARDRLLALLLERRAGTIALSVPTDGEIDVADLAPSLRTLGWTVVLPVVDETEPGRMRFHRWDADTPLRANRYGIAEPVGTPTVEPEHLDVVVVPAVAVDDRGARLGFGGGFYDRILADRSAHTLVVAAVHERQLTDSLPSAPHDQPVDVVVTPTRTRWTARPL